MAYKEPRKNGYAWVGVVELPRKTGEKRNRKTKTFATKREAENWEAEQKFKINSGGYVLLNNITVGEFLNKWLEEYAKTNVAATTYARYEGDIKRHIKPALENIPLQKLSPLHIQQFINRELKGGNQQASDKKQLEPSTVKGYFNILKKALNTAMKWDLIAHNPAERVDPPRVARKEMKYFDSEQASKFLKHCDGEWYGPLLKTALLTGMRMSELLGLQWPHIDLKAGKIKINRVLVTTNGNKKEYKEPKSSAGARSISVHQKTRSILASWKQQQDDRRLLFGSEWIEPDEINGKPLKGSLVFTSEIGTAVGPSNLRRAFKRVIDSAEVPKIRFHDLRHTHATLMLQENVNPKIVSDRLGHSKVSITLDRYSHVIPTMDNEAAASLEKLIL